MTEEALGVGVVGLGRWAHQVAAVIERLPCLELSGAWSRSRERREEFRKAFGCESPESLEELLAREDIQGIIITAPDSTHKTLAEAVAEAGKHVFVEKPIATSLSDARAMIAAASRAGVLLMVGHSTRRLGGHRMMKEWVESGRLGTILQAEGNNSNDRLRDLPEGHWTGRREENPGGPLTQLGVHVADNLIYLLGPVRRVSAFSSQRCRGWDVPDVTGTLLEFHSGAVGYIGSNYASPRWTAFTNLYGERASLYYDRFDGLRLLERGREEKAPLECPDVDIVEEELLEFARSMAEGTKPETDGRVGLEALAVVRGALLSAERGEAVEIGELMDGRD